MSEPIHFEEAAARRAQRHADRLAEEKALGEADVAERARRPSRASLARERFYRSDAPITPDRWICARQAAGYDVPEFAAALGMTAERLALIEAGGEQPTRDEQSAASLLTGMLVRWFHKPPMGDWGPTSAQWHQDWRVCDPCEREAPGGVIAPEDEWAYEAVDACRECGEDVCEAHRWVEEEAGEERVFCDRCHRRWAHRRPRAARGRTSLT